MSNINRQKERNKEKKGKIIQINEEEIHDHISEVVKSTVEETINTMLDAEADQLCRAEKYERSPERESTRAGYYKRKFQTKAGEVKLKMPKLRNINYESAIIQRYRRREASVEEALIEMYLAGVSVRRVEDITEALWGTKVSPGTISNMNKKLYGRIEKWLKKEIEGEHPYVYLDGICLKRCWGGEVKNVSVLVAIGVNSSGHREVLGISEGEKETKESWLAFLRSLKSRGLKGVELIISDKCLGLVEAIDDCYPDVDWQRCICHFYRNVFSYVPRGKMKEVAAMLKAIHAQEDSEAAEEKIKAVVVKLRKMKLGKAADFVEKETHETLRYYKYPAQHWRSLRTNNPLERIMREIRRRTRVVGAFPDGRSALMLAAARLRHIAGTKWGSRAYMKMERLVEYRKEVAIV